MKNVFKLLAIIGCATMIVTGLDVLDGVLQNRAQAQSSILVPGQSQNNGSGQVQIYSGALYGFISLQVVNTNGNLIWTNVPIPAIIPQNLATLYSFTNSAALTNVANSVPTVSMPTMGPVPNAATVFTNAGYDTFWTIVTTCTNSVTGWLTNYTTGIGYPFGAPGGGTTGTNYDSQTVRLGPSDRFGIVTNTPGGIGIITSEIRN